MLLCSAVIQPHLEFNSFWVRYFDGFFQTIQPAHFNGDIVSAALKENCLGLVIQSAKLFRTLITNVILAITLLKLSKLM